MYDSADGEVINTLPKTSIDDPQNFSPLWRSSRWRIMPITATLQQPHTEEGHMSGSDRVQRWRDTKRQQGLEPMTLWLSHEDKARLLDMAQQWHRSPSEMLREALA